MEGTKIRIFDVSSTYQREICYVNLNRNPFFVRRLILYSIYISRKNARTNGGELDNINGRAPVSVVRYKI